MQSRFIVVHICCNEAQLLNSQLRLCPVYFAIKYVNQTLLIPEVYSMLFSNTFVSFDSLIRPWELNLNKIETGMQLANLIMSKARSLQNESSFTSII